MSAYMPLAPADLSGNEFAWNRSENIEVGGNPLVSFCHHCIHHISRPKQQAGSIDLTLEMPAGGVSPCKKKKRKSNTYIVSVRRRRLEQAAAAAAAAGVLILTALKDSYCCRGYWLLVISLVVAYCIRWRSLPYFLQLTDTVDIIHTIHSMYCTAADGEEGDGHWRRYYARRWRRKHSDNIVPNDNIVYCIM